MMDMDMTKCIHEYLLQSVDQDTAVDYKKKKKIFKEDETVLTNLKNKKWSIGFAREL